LRGYAFDPSLSLQIDTATINETVYRIPWEDPSTEDAPDEGLSPGPVGEYLEVVDHDPASGCFYQPVDLNDPYILAQDGLAPSEGSPQFHQQMVYSVAMTTIRNFERALGRPALWASREFTDGVSRQTQFVRRLRIYPHALREANAYYSPAKKALLFGYFPASSDQPGRFLPGGVVFTCLSHDIVAHETTHALLDGMHNRFIEASQPDSLAFHEAFADLVALLQHFSNPDVLRHQIALTRGDLASQNILGELAQQFGEAIGNYGALRSALGRRDSNGVWQSSKPNPDDYRTVTEPHERGAILVAAVFDAFLTIYKKRIADLLRIATSGTGVLPAGELHPDLVNRLAGQAAKTAQHVLTMCVRALDYCPPVDINFGDYLRALITADIDLVPDDDLGYRIAIIEAFRERGIYPRELRSLSVESLCWTGAGQAQNFFQCIAQWLRNAAGGFRYLETRNQIFEETTSLAAKLHDWIADEGYRELKEFSPIAGITFEDNKLAGLRLDSKGRPKFQVSLRPANRVGPDGNAPLNQLIITMIQTREIKIDGADKEDDIMKFRGGCTLILDLNTMRLRYAIRKGIGDGPRLDRYKQYLLDRRSEGSLRATYFRHLENLDEPLALLHSSQSFGRP
jgi:hypothetical protein